MDQDLSDDAAVNQETGKACYSWDYSEEEVTAAVHRPCFTGDYPTRLVDQLGEPGRQQLSLLAEASKRPLPPRPLRYWKSFSALTRVP